MHFYQSYIFTFSDLMSLATLFVAIITATFAGYQIWLIRFSNNADLILKLDDKFNNKDFVETRKRAASLIKSGKIISENKDAIEDILDFFETIGLMVKKGGLDKEIIWHTFFYNIHGYYIYTKDFITSQQKEYSTNRYKEFIYLHDETLKIELKSQSRINEKEWDNFLNDEIKME